MRGLINNQTIDFDIHKAGDRLPIGIEGLHMHKRMNGKKHRGIEVLFPLDDKEDVVFYPSNTSDLTRRQLMNEIKLALNSDKSKRLELVKKVTEEIKRYSGGLPNTSQLQAIKAGAERIAKIFSKNSSIEEEMKQQIESKIKFFISSHKKEDLSLFYIKQDFFRNRIKIGDDLEALNNGNERRKL